MFRKINLSGLEFAKIMKQVQKKDFESITYYDGDQLFDALGISLIEFKSTEGCEIIKVHVRNQTEDPFLEDNGKTYISPSVIAFISMKICKKFRNNVINEAMMKFKDMYEEVDPEDYESDPTGLMHALIISHKIKSEGLVSTFQHEFNKSRL